MIDSVQVMKYIQRNKKWFWFENEFLDFHNPLGQTDWSQGGHQIQAREWDKTELVDPWWKEQEPSCGPLHNVWPFPKEEPADPRDLGMLNFWFLKRCQKCGILCEITLFKC